MLSHFFVSFLPIFSNTENTIGKKKFKFSFGLFSWFSMTKKTKFHDKHIAIFIHTISEKKYNENLAKISDFNWFKLQQISNGTSNFQKSK